MSDDEYEYDDDGAASDASDTADVAGVAALDDDAASDASDASDAAEEEAPLRAARVDPVTRDANEPVRVIVVPADERQTDNRLHKSEAAQVLAVRAQQIAKSAKCFIAGGPRELRDPYAIAFRELYDRCCPLILRRQVGMGAGGTIIVEEWVVREMTLPLLRAP